MKNQFLITLAFITLITSSVFAQTETDSLDYPVDTFVRKENDDAYQEVKKDILEQKTDLSATYPYNKAHKVEIIVSYTSPTNYETLLESGRVNLKPDEINGRKFLNQDQVYRLAQLFNNLDTALCSNISDFPDPMSPRHLVVFYDKKDKAFTFIEVCLEYLTTKVTDSKINKHTICDKNMGIFYDLLFELNLEPHPIAPIIFETPLFVGNNENYQYLTNSETGKTGLKKDEKIIVPVAYDNVLSLGYEGLFQVQLGEKTGFIDAENRIVIPFEYDVDTLNVVGQVFEIAERPDGIQEALISSSPARCGFWDGLCAVVKNGKYGYINKKAQTIIPFIYDGACSFSNGYAIVIKNNKYGVIDTNGKLVVEFIYDWLSRSIHGGDIIYKIENGDEFYLDLH